MKKIIGGKRYDTDTSKKIGYMQHLYPSDFGYYSETLYQKRTGEFFLYGEGGPASRYAKVTGTNEWSGGNKIMPLSVSNAMEWAEENLDADDYESIFGECDEDETKKVVSLSLQVSTVEKIRMLAAERGSTLSDVVDDLVKKA